MLRRYLPILSVGAIGALTGFCAWSAARAAGPPPLAKPAISEDAGAAVAQMDRTLSAPELSFTAKTIRVYLDEAGQPLHIFHTMKVVMRRPDRMGIKVTGDDGSRDLFYDGKSVSIFSPDSEESVAAPRRRRRLASGNSQH